MNATNVPAAAARALAAAGVPVDAVIDYTDSHALAVTWPASTEPSTTMRAAARREGKTWHVDGPIAVDDIDATMIDAADGVWAYRKADTRCCRCARPLGFYTAVTVEPWGGAWHTNRCAR